MANARGIDVSPLARIQLLKHNLDDRYPRDSISKELLQNAEDAPGVSTFYLGWTPGLPAANHQLLSGPALFTVNDGQFSARDAEAINQFGLNYKAVDRTTIGKFGLGLKSVFHLCEAFFYLSSTRPRDGEDAELFNTVVNPWLGTPLHNHTDWKEFSPAHLGLIRQHLAPLLNTPHWFCLWIPLRREAHYSGVAPIRKYDPGGQTTCPAELLSKEGAIFLAEQLPLLRHLSRINVWDRWTGPASANTPLFAASVPATASRSLFPDRLTQSVGVSGKVSMQFRASDSEMIYALWQGWLLNLEEFQGKSGWPPSHSLADDGQSRAEEAQPHCAVSLTRRPVDGPGKLVVSKAVFFPLRAEKKDESSCKDQAEYCLKLHGCFFSDAGRGVRMEAADEQSEESRLKDEWNRRLLIEGVYPLVIPAVAELATVGVMSATALRELTEALTKSRILGDSWQYVCSDWQWAYRWRPGRFGWAKISAKLTILEIPDPGEAGPDLPGEALPRLADLSENYVLTPSDWPLLSAGSASSWPDDALAAVLDTDPESLFKESGRGWAYVRRFVEATPPASGGSKATDALASLLRRTFATVRTHSLRGSKDDVRSVVRGLPADRRLGLPLGNWSEADRQVVLAQQAAVVLVPTEFDPDDTPAAGRLTADEAVKLLRILQPPTQRSKNSNPALAVLSVVQDGTASVLERCAELALWKGDRVTADGLAEEIFRYVQLVKMHQERSLFSDSAESATTAALLASACADRDIVLLPPDTAKVLFGEGAIVPCQPPGLLAAFESAPPLAAPGQRVKLLRYLLGWHADESQVLAWRRAARYLLHEHAESFSDTGELLTRRSGDSSLWGQIVRQGLEHEGDQWRIVPFELARALSADEQEQLGVAEVDRQKALEIIVEVGPENFEWTVLMEVLADSADPPPEVVKVLAEASWLPVVLGKDRLRPCEIIDLKGLEEDIDRAVAAAGGPYSGVKALADKIMKHPGWPTLAGKCFPPRSHALAMLGELLARDSKNHIGAVPVCDENSLRRYIEALGNAPSELVPGVAWVPAGSILGLRSTHRSPCWRHSAIKIALFAYGI